MKKIFLIILYSLLVIFLLSFCFSYRNNRINTEKIKSIRIGMTADHVISILGKPLKIENRYENKGKIFSYTEPLEYNMTYPMLWVHFDEESNVRQVYAKKYILWGADDKCIYLLDSKYDDPKFMNTEQLRAEFK